MDTDKSIVKKTEAAIDDLFDLWKRRKAVCIFVIIIIILPTCWAIFQQLEIKDKNDQIDSLIDSNAGLQSALEELQKVWEIKEETLLKKEFLYTRTNEFPISSDYFLPGELNIDSLTSYNSPNILNVDNLISSFPPYFHYSNEIKKEEEFQDPVTGAMLKVTEIKSDNTANIALYFPSILEPKIDYIKNVSSGKSWEFNYLGKKYEITILDINSTKSSFRVSIQELTSSDIEDVLDLILINK